MCIQRSKANLLNLATLTGCSASTGLPLGNSNSYCTDPSQFVSCILSLWKHNKFPRDFSPFMRVQLSNARTRHASDQGDAVGANGMRHRAGGKRGKALGEVSTWTAGMSSTLSKSISSRFTKALIFKGPLSPGPDPKEKDLSRTEPVNGMLMISCSSASLSSQVWHTHIHTHQSFSLPHPDTCKQAQRE